MAQSRARFGVVAAVAAALLSGCVPQPPAATSTPTPSVTPGPAVCGIERLQLGFGLGGDGAGAVSIEVSPGEPCTIDGAALTVTLAASGQPVGGTAAFGYQPPLEPHPIELGGGGSYTAEVRVADPDSVAGCTPIQADGVILGIGTASFTYSIAPVAACSDPDIALASIGELTAE